MWTNTSSTSHDELTRSFSVCWETLPLVLESQATRCQRTPLRTASARSRIYFSTGCTNCVTYHCAMSARAILSYVTVVLPPLVLAAVGITHPMHLTAASAEYWRNLHIAILPIFPLLGFAPWILVRGTGALLGGVVGVLGFLYAAFYTALDVLAGIGAGGLKVDGMGMATGTVFGLGGDLGAVGSVALIAAAVVSAGTCLVRFRAAAIPGTILVIAGALLFFKAHIYFPVGVIGQLCLGLGWAWLFFVSERSTLARVSAVAPPIDSAVTEPSAQAR